MFQASSSKASTPVQKLRSRGGKTNPDSDNDSVSLNESLDAMDSAERSKGRGGRGGERGRGRGVAVRGRGVKAGSGSRGRGGSRSGTPRQSEEEASDAEQTKPVSRQLPFHYHILSFIVLKTFLNKNGAFNKCLLLKNEMRLLKECLYVYVYVYSYISICHKLSNS